MNALKISILITVVLASTLLIYIIGLATRKKVLKNEEDETNHTFSHVFPLICVILFIIASSVTGVIAVKYASFGAFYDDSWKVSGVDSAFVFKSDDTEALQAIYDANPNAFRPKLYDVILVRLGCDECETAKDIIYAAKAEIEAKKGKRAYIVFSRSDIGQLYVRLYDINHVPVAIVDERVVVLYDAQN